MKTFRIKNKGFRDKSSEFYKLENSMPLFRFTCQLTAALLVALLCAALPGAITAGAQTPAPNMIGETPPDSNHAQDSGKRSATAYALGGAGLLTAGGALIGSGLWLMRGDGEGIGILAESFGYALLGTGVVVAVGGIVWIIRAIRAGSSPAQNASPVAVDNVLPRSSWSLAPRVTRHGDTAISVRLSF